MCVSMNYCEKNNAFLLKTSWHKKGNVLDNAYAAQAKPRNRDLSKTRCYSCKEYGHLANQ